MAGGWECRDRPGVVKVECGHAACTFGSPLLRLSKAVTRNISEAENLVAGMMHGHI